MSEHDAHDKPSLSDVEPLRPIEEVEQAARPGMTDRERALEDRYARQTGDHLGRAEVQVPLAMPGGSNAGGTMSEGIVGAAPVIDVVATPDEDEERVRAARTGEPRTTDDTL